MSNVSVRIAGAGFEPATSGLWARRAARLLYPASIPARHRYAPVLIPVRGVLKPGKHLSVCLGPVWRHRELLSIRFLKL